MEGKSSNGKCRKVGDEIDRISDLPEEILHYILSLSILDTKEVVQTSLVSKRWRNLWMASLPYLNFDHSLWKKIEKTQLQYPSLIEELGFTFHTLRTKHKFMEFIDKVLLLPEGPNICKFNLVGDDYCDEDRFGKWFSCLARKHAQEVYINITPRIYYEFPDDGPEPSELPHSLFTSEIKIFKLEVYTTAVNLSYQLPDSMCSATHLKILHLVSARLPKGDSNGELVFNCPCLENFIMVDCDTSHLNIFDISAPQLQKLVLNSEYWGVYNSCKVRIMTPSLVSFQSNCVFGDYYLENLGCLLSANISLSADKENEAKNSIKLLSGLRNAETLELFFWSKFKASMEIQNIFDQLPHTFHNLKCLKLLMRNDTYINLVANLLKSSPHIEILILEVIQDETTINWGDELSFESKFHQLKSIEIEDIGHCLNPKNCGNLFTLLEFLLKNAVVLENVRLTHCEELSSDDKDEVNKKLEALPRASPSVTILFP